MPELPEVEAARKHLAIHCKGRRIVEIITREQGHGPRHGLFDEMMFEQTLPEDIKHRYLSASSLSRLPNKVKSLTRVKSESEVPTAETPDPLAVEAIYKGLVTNKWVTDVQRKGKQMWLELSSDRDSFSQPEEQLALLLHFGMTGSIVIKGHKIPSYRYRSFYVGENEEWPPKFTKLELVLSGSEHTSEDDVVRVALCDPRRLGYVKMRINPRFTLPILALAPDPVTDPIPTIPAIKDQLAKCSTNIKTLLLNQEKLFCGIGNYLADEILYQSKIHPMTIASEINEEGLATIVTKMREIISHAISVDADYDYFPKDWIFHYRWGKGKGNSPILPNGNTVTYETVNGRTTAFVASEQLKNGYYRVETTEVIKKRKKVTPSSVAVEEDVVTIKRSRKEVVEDDSFVTAQVETSTITTTKKRRNVTKSSTLETGDDKTKSEKQVRKSSLSNHDEEKLKKSSSRKVKTKTLPTNNIESNASPVLEIKQHDEPSQNSSSRRSSRLKERERK